MMSFALGSTAISRMKLAMCWLVWDCLFRMRFGCCWFASRQTRPSHLISIEHSPTLKSKSLEGLPEENQEKYSTGLKRMDRIQQLNYEKDFRIAFLEIKGDGFQRLFERLMSKAHPNDFMACRPWGKVGDRKNDGYLPSARILFQSYAPNELSAAEAIKKINEDFEGAKDHWEQHFDEWTFVHNAPDGRLGPHIIEALAKLRQDNPQIRIGHCGYEEMLAKFRQLSLQDLESWFGPSLTMEANVNLGYSDLMAVLSHISVTPVPTTSEVKDVSRGKIEANLLSQAVADFLKIGMQKSPLVAQFFNNWKNPTYGEQIAQTFKREYIALRDSAPLLHPDEIFGRLEAWAGGSANTTPTHKAAVLAVMAYLFDKCEIFEDAQTVGTA
ncbi:Uncharacterized protein ALO83_03140 [Pseudomonas cannabina pv. alisalensis]|nr:Uncharacterized protein ALO83_03140 [Pseudomonas cannabina pv. alisalensis]